GGVGADLVALDHRIVGANALDGDRFPQVPGNHVAGAGQTDDSVGRAEGHADALALVANDEGAAGVQADVVAGDDRCVDVGAEHADAGGVVAGDNVALGGVVDAVAVAADARIAGTGVEQDAELAVRQRYGPARV